MLVVAAAWEACRARLLQETACGTGGPPPSERVLRPEIAYGTDFDSNYWTARARRPWMHPAGPVPFGG